MIIDEMLKLGLNVLTGDLIGADYCHDEYPGGNYCPEAVVEALSTEDVATVMKLCHETGIPVTVRGAGTGQVGGAVPVKGGIVLSVKGMNKVLDYADGILKVQPGVLLQDVKAEAEKNGMYYPPTRARRPLPSAATQLPMQAARAPLSTAAQKTMSSMQSSSLPTAAS